MAECVCGHKRDSHQCGRSKCSFDKCPCWQFIERGDDAWTRPPSDDQGEEW